MSRVLPSVQHWVVCLNAEPDPPVHRLDGVSYLYRFEPEGGFPPPGGATVPPAAPRLDVFCRFLGGNGPVDLEIRLVWLDAPDSLRPYISEVFGPYRIEFRSEEPVRDVAFQLTQVPLPGLDRYAIELVALPAVSPSGRPTAESGEVLAVEYFTLVSAT